MGATEHLSRFICDTRLDAIPSAVSDRAKQALVDGVAVTLGGHRQLGDGILSFVRQCGGHPVATVIGTGHRTSVPLAALANGTLAHALDYDDLNQSMGGHPTAPVWPAVLAMGEMIHASGREMLLAYLVGVEAETKLGRALIHKLYGSGWHPTAVLGTLGAAAAAAKLLGFDIHQTRMALGMAASFTGGLKHNFGTPTKALHVGQAARNGVTAALLVQQGLGAALDILEAKAGFGHLFCGSDSYDLKDMAHYLGNPWEFESPGIQQKKYPCCGSIHSAVEALRLVLKSNPAASDAVREIAGSVHPQKTHILSHPRPSTGLEAKFSLEYCLVAVLCHGRLSLDHFTDEALEDPSLQALLPRVVVSTDRSLPDWGGRIRLTSVSGEVLSATCEAFPGLTDAADLAAKFHDCADPVLGPGPCEKLMDTLWHVEDVRIASDLTQLMAPVDGE